jgi:NadR type nicotinamide-nucleotide adenylyltransferase
MSRAGTVGLTLGKFAPLHRGHQLVIETALRETEHVLVDIYPAAETNVPLAIRANWIRALYPDVEVIEAWDGPTAVGYTPDVTKLLHGRGVTHFFSSEPYGDHVSRALGARDRRVDTERRAVPISGTAVRQSAFDCRAFVHPVVYRDLVARVVLVGAPSTGKTTLAAALAKHYATVWMPEYGREYWATHNIERRLTLGQLLEIAEGHREREETTVLEANRFLFVDTEAIITSLFSRHYHQAVHPRLAQLANESATRYDLFLLCDTDIPYDDTPDRSGEANRELFQAWICDELASRKIPYVTLRGSVDERLRRATRVLDGFTKYRSLAEQLLEG